jgi:hypothetical protein
MLSSSVSATGGVFSGNDCTNYQACAQVDGASLVNGDSGCPTGVQVTNQGIICEYVDTNGEEFVRSASISPPQLRVLEFWFIRIVYAIWAVAGIFFVVVLIGIGFQYMTSFGNEIALGEVIKKFRYWMIGIALVFLSYPGLNTFFSILAVDTSQDCYQQLDDQLIGFQFFFPNACGTEISQNYSSYKSDITTVCNTLLTAFPLLGDREACSEVADNVIDNCISKCPTSDGGGTPESSCVNACVSPAAINNQLNVLSDKISSCIEGCTNAGRSPFGCSTSCNTNPDAFTNFVPISINECIGLCDKDENTCSNLCNNSCQFECSQGRVRCLTCLDNN